VIAIEVAFAENRDIKDIYQFFTLLVASFSKYKPGGIAYIDRELP